MDTKAELAQKALENNVVGSLTFVNARLKRLRHERHLIERAIVALTDVARGRWARLKRPLQN